MASLYGLIGILFFSLTLPAIRTTVGHLSPLFVGLGRSAGAAVVGALSLALTRTQLPPRSAWPGLMVVAAGAVVGFPLFSTLALQGLPASHGAIVVSLLPLATAATATWLAKERPKLRFWVGAASGSAVVAAFVLGQSGQSLSPSDGLLLLGVALAALGYAEGGRLARSLGGWQVIAWALLLALPVTLTALLWSWPPHPGAVPGRAWLGFGYLCVGSMFLGFAAWYRGLAMGGIARVGQIQLLQPFFTLLAAVFLLGEALPSGALPAAALVVLCVAWGRSGGRRRAKRVHSASPQFVQATQSKPSDSSKQSGL